MNPNKRTLNAIYDGWEVYQNKLIKALAPLTPEQLALAASPSLRSIGRIAAHMIGARARWFYQLLGEGGPEIRVLTRIDRRGAPDRTADELVQGLQTTWQFMTEARKHWTQEQWEQTYPGEKGEPELLTRSWVIWHLLEHDLHHGGEISLTLGMHGLKAPNL